MNKRTPILTLVVLSLLLVVLSACAAPVQPDRDIEISTEAALAAQSALLNGLSTLSVELSESELSSYVTMALEANSGPNQPIDSVLIWIEPDSLHLRVSLKDGVSMPGMDSLDLVGNLMVSDGHLMVDLQQAGAGGIAVGGAMLAPVAAQINAVLAQNMMLPGNVMLAQDTGSLMISMN